MMRGNLRRALLPVALALIACCAVPRPALAGGTGDLFTAWPASARAEGMGGAASAVAGGALGVFANPATLGFREVAEFASTRRTLDLERSIESTAVRFELWPGAESALGYRKHSVENMERRDATGAVLSRFDWREEVFTFAQGMSLGERGAVGFALNGTRDEDGVANATGEGFDLGLLLRGRDMALSLVGRHLAQSKRWRDTATNPVERVNPVIVAGCAFRHGRHLLAVDVEADQDAGERRYRGGVESRLSERLAFRAGVDDGRPAWGFGYFQKGWRLDAGMTSGYFGDTVAATLSFFDPFEKLRGRGGNAAAPPMQAVHAGGEGADAVTMAPQEIAAEPGAAASDAGAPKGLADVPAVVVPVPAATVVAPLPPADAAVVAAKFAAGRRLFLAGDYAAAVDPLLAAVERDPRRADAACLLGICLAKCGRAAEAREILSTALAIDPANPYAKYADVYLR